MQFFMVHWTVEQTGRNLFLVGSKILFKIQSVNPVVSLSQNRTGSWMTEPRNNSLIVCLGQGSKNYSKIVQIIAEHVRQCCQIPGPQTGCITRWPRRRLV